MWMWFLSTYIQMKSEPVFYGRSHLSSSMKLEIEYTYIGWAMMQRKHLHHQQTIHNNELKNGKNPHFQSSFTLFFLYIYTLGCKDNHMAFLSPVDWKNPSATSCWDKTHNQDNFL